MGQLSRRSFSHPLRDALITTQPGIGAYWQVMLESKSSFPGREFMVAESGSELVAMADLRILDTDTSFLSHICVSPEVRGRGIAAGLLTEHLTQHPKVSRMELDVFEDNTSAARLYERLGFMPQTASLWLTKVLEGPLSEKRSLVFNDLHDSQAWFDSYGFCELRGHFEGEPFHVGRIGHHMLRLFSANHARNRRLLDQLRASFPSVHELLLILPEHQWDDRAEFTFFNRSVRMAADDARMTVMTG